MTIVTRPELACRRFLLNLRPPFSTALRLRVDLAPAEAAPSTRAATSATTAETRNSRSRLLGWKLTMGRTVPWPWAGPRADIGLKTVRRAAVAVRFLAEMNQVNNAYAAFDRDGAPRGRSH